MIEELQDKDLPENFHGLWIAIEVWRDDQLNWIEKCILCEIHWLYKESIAKGKSGCWASNHHFSKMFRISKSSISRIISRLVKLGYIDIISFNGRCRIIKSNMRLTLKKKTN